VISIRPLADIFPRIKFLKKLIPLRKSFGILSACVVVTALFAKYIQNPHLLPLYFNISNWDLYYPLLSRLSEITGIILLITSNRFSQKYLKKWWKRIQRSAYIYFISGWLVAAQYGDTNTIYYTMWGVIILWFLAQLEIKIWK
jgi:DMSO/TMAO reductase YedYZ heme-binding membrane subunit